MPKAVVNFSETERVDLKTCPGGFVELRRMSYGLILQRRAIMKLSVTATKGSKNLEGEIAMADKRVQLLEFGNCIVSHNLEDEDGRQLNLSLEPDVSKLDPQIGQEIEKLIEDRNNFEDDDDSGN